MERGCRSSFILHGFQIGLLITLCIQSLGACELATDYAFWSGWWLSETVHNPPPLQYGCSFQVTLALMLTIFLIGDVCDMALLFRLPKITGTEGISIAGIAKNNYACDI